MRRGDQIIMQESINIPFILFCLVLLIVIYSVVSLIFRGGDTIKIKKRLTVICIFLSLLCLFSLVTLVVIRINVRNNTPVKEDWLSLQSPNGEYTIRVISRRPYIIPKSGLIDYELDIYAEKEKLNRSPSYYFSIEIGPIKHGLKDENYEIEWIDNGAILKFKDHRQSLSFVLDFEELFSEISD